MNTLIVVRYNPVLGGVFLFVGLANLTLTLAGGGDRAGSFSGLLLAALGVLFIVGKALVIEPDKVIVRSVIQLPLKTLPIVGLHDLVFDDNVLRLRRDGQKLVNLGWGIARRGDVEALRALVGNAE